MCYDDSTQNMRNLYCFKDLYIGIIVLVVKRRGFFEHFFRFGFNGQPASKSSKKAVIVPNGFIENLNAQPIQIKK